MMTGTITDLRPHIISLKNDGLLDPNGTYGKTQAEVQAIFKDDFGPYEAHVYKIVQP